MRFVLPYTKNSTPIYMSVEKVSNDYKKDIFAISAGDSERSRS